jgi:hypothetical protein
MKNFLPRWTFFLHAFLLFTSLTTFAGNSFTHHIKRTVSTGTLTVTAPADLQVSTDYYTSVATHVSLGTPVVTGNLSDVFTSNDAPASFPVGTTTVLWTASDNDGNEGTAVQHVTVIDDLNPRIFRMGEISVANEPGKCGATVKLFIPFAYDNNGGPVNITNNAPAYFSVGSVLITWTATDLYGNSDTSTQLITVIDNEVPTIAITDVHVNNDPGKCGAIVNLGTPVTTDNCGVAGVTNDAPAFFPTGTTLVHWRVTDNVGFYNTTTQTVVVTDNEKPLIVSPAILNVNNTPGQCGAAISLTAPAVSDNCGVAVISNNAPSFFPAGTTLVTWTATDNNGNTATAVQTVNVKDAEAPVLSGVPANTTVSCDNIPAASALATDNCTAQPVVTLIQTSTRGTDATKSSYYNYTITRTWTAKDAANNFSTAKQVITVNDKTAPVIIVPANITAGNDLNTCGAVVRFTVTATDNCSSPVTLTYSKASGTLFSSGTTTVTVTAKDVSGNTSTRTFTVTVNDTQKPTLNAPPDISVNVNNSSSTVSNLNLGVPVTNDNCGVKTITNDAPSVYHAGTTTVIWTVKDAAGNTATDVQTVTLIAKKKTNEVVSDKLAATIQKETIEGSLNVIVAPNPSRNYFTLKLESKYDMPVDVRIFSESGRLVDTRSKLGANSTLQIGQNYISGVYIAEIIQGTQRKTVQLIKTR